MAEAKKYALNATKMKLPISVADLPLWIGLGVLAVPTLASLGAQVWSTESGAHGPIVLAVGLWLLARAYTICKQSAVSGSTALTWLGLVAALAIYVFGRAFDFISLEVAGLYGAGVSMLHSRVGMKAMLLMWFPVLYLTFLIPPPGWLIDELTAPLKQFVSLASTSTLAAAGIPLTREGVTIFVGSYQLLVEDACSGMNSMVGLIAVSLLYIYLLRGSHLRYAGALLVGVIPLAVLGNIIRVMTLILLTYFFGDEVAQGFLHVTAGLFLFVITLILVFALDLLLWKVLPASWKVT